MNIVQISLQDPAFNSCRKEPVKIHKKHCTQAILDREITVPRTEVPQLKTFIVNLYVVKVENYWPRAS